MTACQHLIIIALCALATMLTRFLPFLLFPAGKPTPKFIRYLSAALPPAVFGMLVIYCLKNIDLTSSSHALPELIAVSATAGLHLWKKQTLLSIVGGTVVYMLLVQRVFI